MALALIQKAAGVPAGLVQAYAVDSMLFTSATTASVWCWM
jgi:hypothetical protein